VTLIELSGACPPYDYKQLGNDYSEAMRDFIAACVTEDIDNRPSAQELLSYNFIVQAQKAKPMLLANYLPIERPAETEIDQNVPTQDEATLSRAEEERIKRLFKEELKIFEEKVLKELQEENAKLRGLVVQLTTHVLKLQSDVVDLKNKRKNKTGINPLKT